MAYELTFILYCSQVKRLEVGILRVEQRLDEKDQILYRTRMEARAKSRFLQKTIQVSYCIILPLTDKSF